MEFKKINEVYSKNGKLIGEVFGNLDDEEVLNLRKEYFIYSSGLAFETGLALDERKTEIVKKIGDFWKKKRLSYDFSDTIGRRYDHYEIEAEEAKINYKVLPFKKEKLENKYTTNPVVVEGKIIGEDLLFGNFDVRMRRHYVSIDGVDRSNHQHVTALQYYFDDLKNCLNFWKSRRLLYAKQ